MTEPILSPDFLRKSDAIENFRSGKFPEGIKDI